ncbi:MAG: SGNH/GDSL hydrolase family protein [Planctomycetes bacterium]|nr:SGNH/GDSL hydrolase family protein [Planctomycetota bacterium]
MIRRAAKARFGGARVTALVCGLALAAAIGSLLWTRMKPGPAPVELRDSTPIDAEKLAARRGELADPALAFAPDRRRLALSPEIALEISPLNVPEQEYDPQCYLRHKANLNNTVPWPEHPKKRWHMRTNSLGLREDRELAPTFDGLRVLCTGDSHTDGVCENSESWPHRLEARAKAAHPDRAIEVINSGKGCYGFYHYRGVLERLAHFEPELFVVGVYGGNDFMETTRPWYYFAGAERPKFDAADWKKINAAKRVDGPGLAQIWTSAYYFHRFPDEQHVALSAALALSADIAGAAGARGMRVLFVYIPSRAEVAPDAEFARSKETLDALGLTRADLDTAGRLTDRYLQGLASLGIPVVDVRERFRREPRPPYWESDLHIDLAGHAAIAEVLEPWLEPLIVGAR